MSKAKKNSVKTQSGDPFTRWLVVGMVTLVVAVGAFFFFTTENKESNASLVALDNFSPIGEFEAVVDPAQGDGIVFNAGLPLKINVFEDFQCPSCNFFEDPIGPYLTSLIT
jgi:protein-disulfide isomerase